MEVLGLADLDNLLNTWLRNKFNINLFDAHSQETMPASEGIKLYIRELYDAKCAVCGICGAETTLVVAHILKTRDRCEEAGVAWDASNFLLLCDSSAHGTSCRYLFDTFQSSFIFRREVKKWSVVGGPHHNKLVTLAS